MKPAKIFSVVSMYAERLREEKVVPQRISPNRSFAECAQDEILAHTAYLVEQFFSYDVSAQYGKLNRHLAAIQMCLSFAGWYTLEEIMEHNRPTE